jgi:hypothetical protein
VLIACEFGETVPPGQTWPARQELPTGPAIPSPISAAIQRLSLGTGDARCNRGSTETKAMSIGGVGSYSNWWQWQGQVAQTAANSNAVANTGSPAAAANISGFMQAFSADLQSALTQYASESSQSATASTTTTNTAADPAAQTAANQPKGTVHHHHRHAHAGGGGGSIEQAATQAAGEIDQSLQGGSLTTSQIDQSASAFATGLMQALQSYGSTTPAASGSSILV